MNSAGLALLSREKKKDQLSQLVPVLNAGVMKLLRFIEREVSDASQGHPLVVDVTDEQKAIALMSFLMYLMSLSYNSQVWSPGWTESFGQ